jgi:hypothetical protein
MHSGQSTHLLRIELPGQARRLFWTAFQRGVRLRLRINLPLREIVCTELGISASYFDTRIQTIFLDGHPVDAPQTAIVTDGSELALSGALPGLVGATLRCGGRYASMRAAISLHQQPAAAVVPRPGGIRLKLFNQALADLVPALLTHGIRMSGHDLLILWQSRGAPPGEGWPPIAIDGRHVPADELVAVLTRAREQEIALQVPPERRNTGA